MADSRKSSFVAFPANPASISGPATFAAHALNMQGHNVKAWPQMDVFGANIPDEIRDEIHTREVLYADVTFANLNVYFESGYAIGLGKLFAPFINTSFDKSSESINNIGIFPNIGYKSYDNSEQLEEILKIYPQADLLSLHSKDVNFSQQLYLMDTLRKTDFRNAIVSAIKESRAHFRSFDPVENPRISVTSLISEVTSSSGVILPYLSNNIDDANRHNARVAFVAGLAFGLQRNVIIITDQVEVTEPLDYRDNLVRANSRERITDEIVDFCTRSAMDAQSIAPITSVISRSELQNLSLGASAAENEFRDLNSYFVETSEFLRAQRGEVNLITGRKGSGKSAIFFQVRDAARRGGGNIVVDLKPESHRLSHFREQILSTGGVGIFEHTIAAFWYFVTISEVLLSVYKRLESASRYDARNFGPMREIEDLFDEYQILEPGDFTTRLTRLSISIARDVKQYNLGNNNLTADQVTNIVYRSGISKIRELIVKHSSSGTDIVFLFDNIDKGWPADGVEAGDITIVRLLIETLEKVRSDFAAKSRNFRSIVFLRHDVFDLLMNQTPDRGKSGQVSIDWTDRAKLAQVIFRRLQVGSRSKSIKVQALWDRIFPEIVSGRSSFDYFADHCLMRPRFLIDIIELAIANAVNRGHLTVLVDDCVDAVFQHSASLVDDFGFEMRDVSGLNSELLYSFIGCDQIAKRTYFLDALGRDGLSAADAAKAFELMIWYGLLGIIDKAGVHRYIYDYSYNMKRLKAEIASVNDANFVVNSALFAGLK